MSPTKKITTSLIVDKLNRIIAVDDKWLDEAELGNAEDKLQPEKIMEHFLADYIQDDNTTMYVEAILALCRLRNEKVYRPYRCDSPTHKRFMELELIPQSLGQVKMVHYLLKEEAFENEVTIEDIGKSLKSKQKTNANKATRSYYLRCSMCNALKAPDSEEWRDPGEISTPNLNHFKVIHTVCKNCSQTPWKRRN